MVDSEYSTEGYKSSKISNEAIIKNLEMVKFLPDYLKSKKRCVNTKFKKFSFATTYVPSQYKTQQMYNKAINKIVER